MPEAGSPWDQPFTQGSQAEEEDWGWGKVRGHFLAIKYQLEVSGFKAAALRLAPAGKRYWP